MTQNFLHSQAWQPCQSQPWPGKEGAAWGGAEGGELTSVVPAAPPASRQQRRFSTAGHSLDLAGSVLSLGPSQQAETRVAVALACERSQSCLRALRGQGLCSPPHQDAGFPPVPPAGHCSVTRFWTPRDCCFSLFFFPT